MLDAAAGKPDNLARFVVAFAGGQVIYREGDSGSQMYLIRDGQVEIVHGHGERERRLALLEAGDFFGEMSVLEGAPRNATARALTAATLVAIDAAGLDRVLREHPEIAARMLRTLSHRLREFERAQEEAAWAAHQVFEAPPPESGAPAADSPGPRLAHRLSFQEFPLAERAETTIGRGDPQSGFTPDIDLTALDTHKSLSRRHARVLHRGGGFLLREESGVANGTYVNGERLEAGVDRPLADGDELRFGLVAFTFRLT